MSRLRIALFLLPLRLRRLWRRRKPAEPVPCPDFLPDHYDLPTTDHLNDDHGLLNSRRFLEYCLDLDPAYYIPRRCNNLDVDP